MMAVLPLVAIPLALAQQIEPEGRDAFSQPLSGIDSTMLAKFNYGKGLFHHEWQAVTHADGRVTGLGPDFNARSCGACHVRDGRGVPPKEGATGAATTFVLLMQNDGQADAVYGAQLRDQSIYGAPPASLRVAYEESRIVLADGSPVNLRKPTYSILAQRLAPPSIHTKFGPRMAQQLVGMGLLERVNEDEILANADPMDADQDGVSGRPNMILDFAGEVRLGRFGWKASTPDLANQTIAAAKNDIGLDLDELPMQDVGSIDHYLELLGVPKRRIADQEIVTEGEKVFAEIGCGACHVGPFLLSNDLEEPFRGREVAAYTDLLLHDMGPELADGTVIGSASQLEWRTAPLWGIGRTKEVTGVTYFLHDGRARNLMEAIVWHGGEAQKSRDAFVALPLDARQSLLAFLTSL